MGHVFQKLSLLLVGLTSFSFVYAQPASLNDVFAPVWVSSVPSDAYIGLSRLDDGEIRHYNYGEQPQCGTFYLSSKDNGLTWKKVSYAKDMLFADRKSPISNEYIRLTSMDKMGTYAIRTVGGLNGGRTLTKVSDTRSIMLKPPVFIRNGQRIVVAGHGDVSPKGCYTYISDDDGVSWQRSNIVTAPDHQKGGIHKGIRWNHGAVEPTVVELNDGRLWMLMRTSQDKHYEAFSDDGGLTWGQSRPSLFYGTITMPTIERLSDGRLLFFWCNTTPLPEMETANGVWDDVFTNRDATHVAISEDDGKTWIGFRELRLNPNRNDSDYASGATGVDRSVHQAQMVEVAPNKILVATGQHELLRGMFLFDVNWLYEKTRFCNFSDGLNSWCIFNYIKGIKGHCAYDRVEGCQLIPLENRNVLRVKYKEDTNLVSDIRGAVWNFPTMKKGNFSTSIRIPADSDQIYLLLNDRWFNPSDIEASNACMYKLPLNRKQLGIKDDQWHTIFISWDTEKPKSSATVFVDGKKRSISLPLLNATEVGINYAHFMALPSDKENEGIDIEWVKAQMK